MAKWADPSERCRELARREREIYDQQELPDLLEHMAEENARLRAEAANTAAQRDEAEKRAQALVDQTRAVQAALERTNAAAKDARDATTAWRDRALAAEAELALIRAADRNSITVRTTEAAKMRKGQAI